MTKKQKAIAYIKIRLEFLEQYRNPDHVQWKPRFQGNQLSPPLMPPTLDKDQWAVECIIRELNEILKLLEN